MTAPLPTFPEFYRVVNGRNPFPWQTRLAKEVAANESWPNEIGVPTGMGKTACLEIAVWWLASQADRAPEERTAPTRIWWVVNRRLLVDSTAEQACKLAKKLEDALQQGSSSEGDTESHSGALAAVAERMCSLSAGRSEPPLKVISLRGGLAYHTPTDPSCPTVILCTLPMYGSRLLFRGYGSRLRAVDAAMAGTDSLVLLDEAHLAPHLRSLTKALNECIPGAQPLLGNQRSTATVVTLTATGDPAGQSRFDLDDDDRRHVVVQQRLDATKRLELQVETSGEIARHLADGTIRLMGEAGRPASFLVFANTPKTAREVFNILTKKTKARKKQTTSTPVDLQLLTGLTREREAERIRKHILDREQGMAATRPAATPRERHLVVVATQTLEVGADLDAEYLITEACGVRALTQRLGRLNRLGNHDDARALYIHVPPEKRRGGKDKGENLWPVYGQEPEHVRQRLKDAQQQSDEDQTVNLSPRQVTEVLGPPDKDLGRAPEVLPGILWEWVKTTTPPEGEAPVEPYFSGIGSPEYTVSVIWRIHVPEPGQRLWPRAKDREAVDISRHELQDVLTDAEAIYRLGSDGVTVETTRKADLRAGDRIVLPTDCGLLDEFGWNPSTTDPVMDVSLVGQGLPLDARAIQRLCNIDLTSDINKALGTENDEINEIDEAERDQAISNILEAIRAAKTPQSWDPTEWSNFTDSLEPSVVESRREVPRLKVRSPQPEEDAPIDDFDENSVVESVSASNRKLATLAGHGEAVGEQSRMVAERVGLPAGLCEVVEFAARLHDIGKADRRFQRWLDPEDKNGVAMAKSDEPRRRWEAMRVQSGWPRGGRHEDLSARLVLAWLQQQPDWGTPIERDLLVHLVISHHGKGRPLVPPAADGTGEHVRGVVDGVAVEASADLARIDWEQPARFRRLNDHFGPWGLALLEAILIRSDHAVSASMNGGRTSWK